MTAIVRNKEYKNESVKVVYKDIFELTKADLAGFDAVISAFAAWSEETFPLHKKVVAHLVNLLEGTSTRLIVALGAGTLFDDSKGRSWIRQTLQLHIWAWQRRQRSHILS
ncbi:hypothetical protein [Campylobacter concisus]|uniref:hypothetical protein n=1 Tax=Campylobacter concisus TaxID=199 RepID=UPI0039B77F2E